MTTISIVPESPGTAGTPFLAVAGQRQSQGSTVGQALDALAAQLTREELGTLIIVQTMQPDCFFPKAQADRLAELMRKWRQARDRQGVGLSSAEDKELEDLVDLEIHAATLRAQALTSRKGS